MEAVRSGWLQGRYHGDGGDTVADMLSFKAVFEINPFEVGTTHAKERRIFAARRRLVDDLLDVRELRRRPFLSLSNGEMRRVLFARAILKGPDRLVLDDPLGGLDPERRARMRTVVAELARHGIEVVAPTRRERNGGCPLALPVKRHLPSTARAVVEMRHIDFSFGGKMLFRDFSWTIREGERWLLCGPNGSGKTTLLALITGDAPRSYACDISVFGKRRGGEGVTLAGIRAKIGEVSAERQVYLGETPERQLAEALSRNPRLLLLDEPCYNLTTKATKRLLRKVAAWLDGHPRTAAVCVAHRPEHVPAGFSLTQRLGSTGAVCVRTARPAAR